MRRHFCLPSLLVAFALPIILGGCAAVRPPAPPTEPGPFTTSWRSMGGEEIIDRARYETIRLTADFTATTTTGTFEAPGIIYGEESGRFRVRLYRYGMVSADVLVTPDGTSGLPEGSDAAAVSRLTPLLRTLLFWWTRYSPADLSGYESTGPVFSTPSASTLIDGPTLTPREQNLFADGGGTRAVYEQHRQFGDRWFPARIQVSGAGFEGSITVGNVELDGELPEGTFPD